MRVHLAGARGQREGMADLKEEMHANLLGLVKHLIGEYGDDAYGAAYVANIQAAISPDRTRCPRRPA